MSTASSLFRTHKFESFPINVLSWYSEPRLILREVCAALGEANPIDSIKRVKTHVPQVFSRHECVIHGSDSATTNLITKLDRTKSRMITPKDMVALVTSSRKKERAQQFLDWARTGDFAGIMDLAEYTEPDGSQDLDPDVWPDEPPNYWGKLKELRATVQAELKAVPENLRPDWMLGEPRDPVVYAKVEAAEAAMKKWEALHVDWVRHCNVTNSDNEMARHYMGIWNEQAAAKAARTGSKPYVWTFHKAKRKFLELERISDMENAELTLRMERRATGKYGDVGPLRDPRA